jgi:hypothetical protein
MTDNDNLLASLTGFTPGPWRVEQSTTLIWGDCTDDLSSYGMGYPVAQALHCASSSWTKKPDTDTAAADADLIAAAPDLLRIALERGAENKKLHDALSNLILVLLSDDHPPFGGEIYQDKVDRFWNSARAAIETP